MAIALATPAGLQLACEWFARCPNTTLKAAQHPVLGPVPCCERCATRLGLDLVDVEITVA